MARLVQLFFGSCFGFNIGSRGFLALIFLPTTVCSSSDDGKLPDEIDTARNAVYSSSDGEITGVLAALVSASSTILTA